eukprot:9465491-Pyramimonas_sp.AAC.1
MATSLYHQPLFAQCASRTPTPSRSSARIVAPRSGAVQARSPFARQTAAVGLRPIACRKIATAITCSAGRNGGEPKTWSQVIDWLDHTHRCVGGRCVGTIYDSTFPPNCG